VLLIHGLLDLYYFRIAGSDTTSTSLSYVFWELSRRADIVKKLQAELDETMHDTGTIPSTSVLQELPYLNAFIKEGSLFLLTSCLHT
jgi:cytochrome P450